MLRRRGG
jgi:hypothetical protein